VVAGVFSGVNVGARAIVPRGATAYGVEGSLWHGLNVTYAAKLCGGAVNGTVMLESFGYRTLTVSPLTTTTGQNVEYAISTTNDGTGLSAWQSSRTFTNLQNRNYYVYARSVSNDIYDAGSYRVFTMSATGWTGLFSLTVTDSVNAGSGGLQLIAKVNGVWREVCIVSGSNGVTKGIHSGSFAGGFALWAIEDIGLR
jgi:hypothetical protein